MANGSDSRRSSANDSLTVLEAFDAMRLFVSKHEAFVNKPGDLSDWLNDLVWQELDVNGSPVVMDQREWDEWQACVATVIERRADRS